MLKNVRISPTHERTLNINERPRFLCCLIYVCRMKRRVVQLKVTTCSF